ncbi:MAG: PEP-CTERM sorting domain-containing protein [Roseiarcus sp.]
MADIIGGDPFAADILSGTTGNTGVVDFSLSGSTRVGAAPEASTWAMMLLGFAGLGLAGYRKAQGGRIAPSVA